jgi:hypothetical protein
MMADFRGTSQAGIIGLAKSQNQLRGGSQTTVYVRTFQNQEYEMLQAIQKASSAPVPLGAASPDHFAVGEGPEAGRGRPKIRFECE